MVELQKIKKWTIATVIHMHTTVSVSSSGSKMENFDFQPKLSRKNKAVNIYAAVY